MKRIAVMIGSDSDLPQCREGLQYLKDMRQRGLVSVETVYTMNIHHNTEILLDELRYLSQGEKADVIIAGDAAGNQGLASLCNAYLRDHCGDGRISVIGVTFEKPGQNVSPVPALQSITRPSKTQALSEEYIGCEGFLQACRLAVEGYLPKITFSEDCTPHVERTLDQALAAALAAAA